LGLRATLLDQFPCAVMNLWPAWTARDNISFFIAIFVS
jgi:hypothetical protein